MTAVTTMMMDKQSPKDYIQSLAVRDVNDTLVLRKMRLLQMAVWTGCPKVRTIYPRPSKDVNKDEADDDLLEDDGQPSGTRSVVKRQGANMRLVARMTSERCPLRAAATRPRLRAGSDNRT